MTGHRCTATSVLSIDDPMPFGPYAGKAIGDIPSEHLLLLDGKLTPVQAYIDKHRGHLIATTDGHFYDWEPDDREA